MDDLQKMVEETLAMSDEDLKKALPDLMGALKGNVGALMDSVPDLVPKLMGKIATMDIGAFVKDAPEASAQFMDILWEGASAAASKSEEVKTKLKAAGNIKVNFEASDSPLKGHLHIADGGLSGGSNLLPEKDLTIAGPTDVMVGILTGSVDPVKGFMTRKYTMKGSMSLGMKLAPAMGSLTKMFSAK